MANETGRAVEALEARLPRGYEFDFGSKLIDWRHRKHQSIATLEWPGDPYAYGVVVETTVLSQDAMYPGESVWSIGEWAESVATWLTYLIAGRIEMYAQRRLLAGILCLDHRPERSWPSPQEFGHEIEILTPAEMVTVSTSKHRPDWMGGAADGGWPEVDGDRRDVFHVAYATNKWRTAKMLGVCRTQLPASEDPVAHIVSLRGSSEPVEVDLAYHAAHRARESGFLAVSSARSFSGADMVGFVPSRGLLMLDTQFLECRPLEARKRLTRRRNLG